jgi:hypothetical protein
LRADGYEGESWSRRAGEALCPIGQAFCGHMTLVLGASGTVYAGMDDILKVVAPTLEAAVEVLTSGRLLTDDTAVP